MITPFIFGKVAANKQFIDREDEQKRLAANFRSGLNTILMSPRRYGKSSLVQQVGTTITSNDKQIRVCMLDLFTVNSEKEFLELLAKEVIKKSASRWEEWVKAGKEFIKSVVPVFSMGIDPQNDFELRFEFAGNEPNYTDLLNLPERIAEHKKLKFIICIDEFQKLANFSDSLFLQQKLRSVWQLQKNTGYCLYGSRRHLINDMFQNPSMPFYRFGDTMYLPKIDQKHWYSYIINAFAENKKNITDKQCSSIIEKAQNHPYYVQQLAHQTFINTKKKVTTEILEKAVDDIFQYNDVMYRREVENLSELQINMLLAIANEVENFSSKETVKKYRLGTSGNVQRLKQSLETKEIIDFFEKKPLFIDPLFQLWLKTNCRKM